MIPNAVDVVEVQNNIDGEDTGQFTVDENSLAKIMSVLTNLYADPEGAVVREYLTNALDAQIEAQETVPGFVWRPIEVSTPSHFSKSYVVRDFGIGMNADDIKDIYSKYGKSTKETSNAVTGMLGLGSKCALTYTNQFTITGYKGGVMTKAIVTKDEADVPNFMIVDTRATTEPNGVEISVPVRDRNSFETKTRHFLKFWKDGQVLINGKEPEKHGLTEVKPGVFLVENTYNGNQSYVVMGNVPYGVEYEYVEQGLRDAGMGFVAYVEMGSIDFPPSREKLMMTSRTRKTVEAISAGLWESVVAEKVKEITDAPNHREAYIKWVNLPYQMQNHKIVTGLTYKGDKFPARNWQGAVDQKCMRLWWNYNDTGQVQQYNNISTEYITNEDTLIVTGVVYGSKPTSYFKKKVRQYQIDKGYSTKQALFVEKDFDNPWWAHLPRVSADEIKKVKLPVGQSPAPRGETPYDFYMIDDAGTITDGSEVTIKIPKGYTMCYISPNDMRETYRKRGCQPKDLLARLGEKVILVVLGRNRFEKFLRTYKDAVPVSKVYQERMDWLVANTSDLEFVVKTLDPQVRKFLMGANPKDITDPDLADLAKKVNGNNVGKTNYEVAQEMHAWSSRAEIRCTLKERKAGTVTDITTRYPLLTHYHQGRQNKHLTYYVNAVYDTEYAPKP